MIKRFLFTSLLLLFICSGLFAQYNMQAPVPLDPQIRTGKLSNGMTYYVRHNAEPKERAHFYIIQNVGAILENDNQNGLAHFLEHMAFNGTKHFPGRKGILNVLEKYGIEAGKNINAYTAQDETVYNINDVPTTHPGLLDTCLLVLHDWSCFLTLAGDEIEAERGVITEEWRTRRTSEFRIRSQIIPVLLKDSKYAIRDVIGDLNIIKNFKPQTLRDFYHQWYGPDLQAIVVVGDFDAEQMEKKIIERFSTIPPRGSNAIRKNHPVPSHDEIYYVLATDPEATSSHVSVYIKFPSIPKEQKNHAYLKHSLLQSLYNGMLNQRIEELLHKGNVPFIEASSGFSTLVRDVDCYCISVTAKPNKEAEALEAIYRENIRVLRYGFTEEELERIKTNLLAGLESAWKEKEKTTSNSWAGEMKDNFLQGEPIMDFEYYYNFTKMLLSNITATEISALAQQYITRKNMVIVVDGPSEDVKHISKEEAIAVLDKTEQTEISPYKEQSVQAVLVKETLLGSKIVKTIELPQFNAEEWTLANGAQVIFRKANYEKDLVNIYSYSKGGTSLYDVDKLASAQVTAQFVDAYGLGDYDAITLNKLMTGKQANTKVAIQGRFESVEGASTPQDLETLLQLIYLRFEQPRFDQAAHEAIMQQNYASVVNIANNPQKIMQDTLNAIMNCNSPRVIKLGKDFLDKITLRQIEEIYRDRIRDASDFIFFIVGNVEAETVKPLVEKYIGSIKSYHRKENARDNKIRGPKGKTEQVIELDLATPKSTVIINFTRYIPTSRHDDLCLNILKGILEQRYSTGIREKEGGTYGVGTRIVMRKEPVPYYAMTLNFDCDPDKAPYLKSLIYAGIEKIQSEGPTQREINKIVAAMKKNNEQGKQHNMYWLNVLRAYYIDHIDITDPGNFERILDQINPEDIRKFAQKMFKNADIVDIIFRPKTQL